METATWGIYQEMIQIVKFVIDTKNFGLIVEPKIIENLEWNLNIFCDSDWAGDLDTRINAMGFVIYLLNIPICWPSEAQRGVTLSSTEEEYGAISEAVKEIRFVSFMLNDIHA
jgi:hypothetical protein